VIDENPALFTTRHVYSPECRAVTESMLNVLLFFVKSMRRSSELMIVLFWNNHSNVNGLSPWMIEQTS
jgi:hypothetical protein